MKNIVKKLALITIGVVIGRVIEKNSFKDISDPVPNLLSS